MPLAVALRSKSSWEDATTPTSGGRPAWCPQPTRATGKRVKATGKDVHRVGDRGDDVSWIDGWSGNAFPIPNGLQHAFLEFEDGDELA